MSKKQYHLEGKTLEIHHPDSVIFENMFFETVYRYLFDHLPAKNFLPHIDFDIFHNGQVPFDIVDLAVEHEVRTDKSGTADVARIKAMLAFLRKYPFFFNVLKNINADAGVTIEAAEFVAGEKTSPENFVAIKKRVDDANRLRWTRDKNKSESQSGVSTLGTISEKLLETALEEFIDDTNFFKNNTSDVQSYGDFVLMCLPNNLWISVKSNFARERLLASGFTTDIIGVGFFEDDREFTSGAKIRNFQKVGFLAMYVPDIPITEAQVAGNTSTYSAIVSFYESHEKQNFPLNINGQPFIRKLSELGNDIKAVLSEKNVKKRTTIGF